MIFTKPSVGGTCTTFVLERRRLELLGDLLNCPHLTRSGPKLPLVPPPLLGGPCLQEEEEAWTHLRLPWQLVL